MKKLLSVVFVLLAGSLCLNAVLMCRLKNKPDPVPAKTAEKTPEKTSDSPKKIVFQDAHFNSWTGEFNMNFSGVEDSLQKKVRYRIVPEVKNVKVSVYGGSVCFSGNFVPETLYTVTVCAGLTDGKGKKLEKDAASVFRTRPKYPLLRFLAEGPYLPLAGGREIPVQSVNVSKVTCTLYRSYANNLNILDLKDDSSLQYMDFAGTWEEEWKNPRNQPRAQKISLDRFIQGGTPGVYRLEVRSADPHCSYVSDRAVLVVTDLAVQAAENHFSRQLAVQVRRLSDGKAVPGAALELISAKNQHVGSGVTDAGGTALIKYDDAFDTENDCARTLIVRKGKDLTYFTLDYENFIDSMPGGRDEVPVGEKTGETPNAFIYAGRGIFRPGETADFSLFVRRREKDKMTVCADTPCTLEIRNPDGKTVQKAQIRTDKNGFASVSFKLPESSPRGMYRAVCLLKDTEKWGFFDFLVGSFVPDRIQLSAEALARDGADLASPVKFRASARYYFGSEVPDVQWGCRMSFSPAAKPAHWQGWQAGSERKFPEFHNVKPEDGAGSDAVFTYPGVEQKAFAPVLLTAEIHASEPGGNTVTDTVRTVLCPTPDFIGLRKKPEASSDAVMDYTLLAFDRSVEIPAKRGVWQVKLEKIRWAYLLTKSRDGRISRSWQEEKVPCEEYSMTLKEGASSGSFRFAELPEGQYVATVSDETGLRVTELKFWHAAGEGSARSASPLALDIRLDKPVYRAGETAELRFNTPFAGNIFGVCGETGMDKVIRQTAGEGRNTVKIAIPETLLGDAYFAGITFDGIQDGKRIRTFGAVRIPVSREDVRLKVSLKVPDKARPGERVTAEVTLKDAAGNPCGGAVQLFGTDMGVLSLTGFATPDIVRHFWGRIRSPIAFYDMLGRIYPDLKITEDGQIAGDGVNRDFSGQDRLSDLKTAAMMLPLAEVPASGTVRIPFEVPEHRGVLRMMAVASSPDSAGSAESEMTVRETAGCMVSMPRAAAPGDEFDCTLAVFNFDEKAGEAEVDAVFPDGMGKNLHFEGKIPAGQSKVFTARVKIPETLSGVQKAAVTLKLGSYRKTQEVSFVVRDVRIETASAQLHAVRPGEVFDWNGSSDGRKGKVRNQVTVLGSPVAGLEDALDFLNGYPYGCLEQTVAKAFPLLAARDLVKAGLIPEPAASSVADRLEETYANLLAMRRKDGSFSAWPGGRDAWLEGTVFAAHFFAASFRAGVLQPDSGVTEPLQSLLSGVIQNGEKSRLLRAYSAYVLALYGRDSCLVETRSLLLEKDDDLAAFFAGAALIRLGYASDGRPAMQKALRNSCYRDSGLSLGGDLAAAGMMLAILMETDPDESSAAGLALYLQSQLRKDGSGWGVTQNNAWAVLGLARFAAEYPAEVPEAEVADGAGKPLDWKPGKAFALPAKGVRVTNRGKGVLWVRVRTGGVSSKPEKTGGSLKVSRAILNAGGEEVASAKHGELLQVRLTVEAPCVMEDLAVCDLLPGGLQIEDSRLATRSATPDTVSDGIKIKRLEKCDDRLLLFCGGSRRAVFTYSVRAVTRGKFHQAEVRAEAMYDAELKGVFVPSSDFEVE